MGLPAAAVRVCYKLYFATAVAWIIRAQWGETRPSLTFIPVKEKAPVSKECIGWHNPACTRGTKPQVQAGPEDILHCRGTAAASLIGPVVRLRGSIRDAS